MEQFSTVDQIGDRQKAQGPGIDREDALTQYLGSSKGITTTLYYLLLIFFLGTRKISPCVFWKCNQYEFPILASLARDVLSVPATGSGVFDLISDTEGDYSAKATIAGPEQGCASRWRRCWSQYRC